MKKRTIFSALLFMAVFAILLSNVSAFGIGSSYFAGHPLELNPGETANVSLGLQNMIGDQNLTLRASIIGGADIAQITDASKDYFVPLGSNNQVSVNLRVTIPSTDTIGKEYTVTVVLATVTLSQAGGTGATLGASIEKSFPVLVKGTAEKTFPAWAVVLIVVIVIVIIILIKLLAKRKPQLQKKR